MKIVKIFLYPLLFSAFMIHAEENQKLIPIQNKSDRSLCTTITQAQQVRFDRCMNGEVMTGIRSLDPLMVYCTRLLANCPGREKIAEKVPTSF